MPSPTRAQIETMISDACHLLEETRKYAEVNATNWIGLEDTFKGNLVSSGPYTEAASLAVQAARGLLSGTLSRATASSMLEPLFTAYARFIMDVPTDRGIQYIMDELWKYMIDNSYAVTSRQFTFGSAVAGGGNTGDGTIYRITTDKDALDIENQHVDVKTATVRQDQQSGSVKHEEVFEMVGAAPGQDNLDVDGSGASSTLRAYSARDSLLINPSFSNPVGTAANPTALTGWVSSAGYTSAVMNHDGTNYYRDYEGDSTPYALSLVASTNITQAVNVRKTNFNPRIPYILRVAWNRAVNAATGTLTMRMGNVSTAVVMAAQAGWNVTTVPDLSSAPENAWYENFNEDSLDIRLEWAETGGTGMLIDDVLLVPGQLFDGSWYFPIGGATPWLNDDVFTFTDSATDAIIQRWVWRAFGRYIPHATGGSITWADP